jgi:shikimate dehydrogenase
MRPSILLGLIGSGIQASLTPALHETEGAAHGLRTVYQLIDIEKLNLTTDALPALLTAAEHFGFAGLNITHPCKQAILPLLHEVSPEADALGAVNTVVLRDGRRIGHNTDAHGFAESFRRSLPDAARANVVQMGAGGAGSAVAWAALALGVERLCLFDVDRDRAEALTRRLRSHFGPNRISAGTDLPASVAAADGIINATPVGMVNHPGLPLPAELLRPSHWVAEVIYFPIETELLRAAGAIGCRTLGGGGMAVFQAVGAFRLFTGLEPDANRMQRHFEGMTGAGMASPAADS